MGNSPEAISNSTEIQWKDYNKIADNMYNLLQPQWSWEEFYNLCKTLSTVDFRALQAKCQIKSNEATDPSIKNEYDTLIEICEDFCSLDNTPITAAASSNLDSAERSQANIDINKDCLTFRLYSWLKLENIQETVINRVNSRKDPTFSHYRLRFPTLKTPKEKQETMKEIQRYLNLHCSPNPPLQIDGNFGQATYTALCNLPAKTETITSTAANWIDQINPNIIFTEQDIGPHVKLSGWRGKWEVTRAQLIEACNLSTIPNQAKNQIKSYLQTSDVHGLQTYLDGLLNPATPITSWPYIDRKTFAFNITSKYDFITPHEENWKDRNDTVPSDGWLWPQTLMAIMSITEATNTAQTTPEPTTVSPQPETLSPNQQTEGIIKEISDSFGLSPDAPTNINVNLSTKEVKLTFKETIDWNKNQENTFIYRYGQWEIAFQLKDKPSQPLQLDELKITKDLSQALKDDEYFGCVAQLSKLFSQAKSTKCKGFFLCKYDDQEKRIKVNSFSYESSQFKSIKNENLFENNKHDDTLKILNDQYFRDQNQLPEEHFTTPDNQKKIAKFMTWTIERSHEHCGTFMDNLQILSQNTYKKDDFDN